MHCVLGQDTLLPCYSNSLHLHVGVQNNGFWVNLIVGMLIASHPGAIIIQHFCFFTFLFSFNDLHQLVKKIG